MPLSLVVNGQPRSVDVLPDTPLLWVLRDTLGLTGTKYGCGIGAVRRLHGAPRRRAPCAPARPRSTSVQGKSVTTIEGLVGRRPPPAAAGLARRSRCRSAATASRGMLMTAAALLAGNPRPTDAEIDARAGRPRSAAAAPTSASGRRSDRAAEAAEAPSERARRAARRDFLQAPAPWPGRRWSIGFRLHGDLLAQEAQEKPRVNPFDAWVRIDADGARAADRRASPRWGRASTRPWPMILAEELDVDWEQRARSSRRRRTRASTTTAPAARPSVRTPWLPLRQAAPRRARCCSRPRPSTGASPPTTAARRAGAS